VFLVLFFCCFGVVVLFSLMFVVVVGVVGVLSRRGRVQERSVLSRDQGVLSPLQHEASEVAHDGVGLKVQVAEHFVGTPAADEADDVRVNLGEEEGHGPTRAKRAGGDVVREEANARAEGRDGEAEGKGYIGGGDGVTGGGTAGSGSKVGGKGSGGRGVVLAKVEDTTNGGQDGTRKGGATAAQADDFTPDAVFLSGICVGGEGGGVEFRQGSKEEIDSVAADEELDVGESEGHGVGGTAGVFPWSHEEEESDANHVGDGGMVGGGGDCGGIEDVVDDGDGDGFDPGRRRIGAGVAAKLALEAEVDGAGGG